jgi:hypothetical protein
MEYTVLVRVDAAGSRPVLVRSGEELRPLEGVRWSLYGQTNDHTEAMRLLGAPSPPSTLECSPGPDVRVYPSGPARVRWPRWRDLEGHDVSPTRTLAASSYDRLP